MLLIFFTHQKGTERGFCVKGHRLVENDVIPFFAILISVCLGFNSLCFKFDRHYYQIPISLWDSTTGLREDFIYLFPVLTYAAFKQEISRKRQTFPTLLTVAKYLEHLSQTLSHGVLPEQKLSLSSLEINKEGRNLLFFPLEVASGRS